MTEIIVTITRNETHGRWEFHSTGYADGKKRVGTFITDRNLEDGPYFAKMCVSLLKHYMESAQEVAK